ncbi:hypothetical protein GCM10017783_22410 [Deinococcus piscis]|uniref:Uncharacterized protein n=1 Tax=Deinococcus piscis TaxID=394230 RepID=A0ABQ3K9S4_9DEIO|nr:hypothetical protein GCM10017783_22410 [Deinococcus piscis]
MEYMQWGTGELWNICPGKGVKRGTGLYSEAHGNTNRAAEIQKNRLSWEAPCRVCISRHHRLAGKVWERWAAGNQAVAPVTLNASKLKPSEQETTCECGVLGWSRSFRAESGHREWGVDSIGCLREYVSAKILVSNDWFTNKHQVGPWREFVMQRVTPFISVVRPA